MAITPISPSHNVFDDDDDEGWQDMPVVKEDEFLIGLDEEDKKKYHYVPSTKGGQSQAHNATGNLIDFDDEGNEWRSKAEQNESEYTRLRGREEDDADEVHLRTKYLFDEDKAMTPLSQMQATKNLLTEAQRIAYVGLCALTSREMSQSMKLTNRKELKAAVSDMELWSLKIMGRLYYHMELETQEQKMIESLGDHGVIAMDLVPALMTTHTVANPEYDPEEARRQTEEREFNTPRIPDIDRDDESISGQTLVDRSPTPSNPTTPRQGSFPKDDKSTSPNVKNSPSNPAGAPATHQTTQRVLNDTSTSVIPGVTTSLSSADQNVTLDIRWTVLCDLFLVLIADSVYDARSRVLLENVAYKLGLGWTDVVKFESRVTEALEIQEDVETMEQKGVVEEHQKQMKKRRYVMLGLATLGGGLVIGLSAGLLAPVIGAGIGAALGTVGVSGATGFLAGAGGAAVITTGGVLTGSGIAVRGMAKRTQLVRTFDILPLHNNKRVSCILTVPGFMNGPLDDVRLPFSVLDPVVGDVFSVLWEPEMIQETGSALKILTGEVLSQIGITVLQATVMSALMTALQWPIILTKLGYLIDNPWNNALDRARGAGKVLAEVLMQRHLGVRPITLIGFSLGSRVIFYALLELHKQKAFGIVQDVFLLGATLTASTKTWCEARSVVSGRFVNAYARNDWVLNYLFRATSGGVGTVAGLRPVPDVPGLENVDVTDKISGHMSYRTFMPLILDQLGFPVSADFFDEPEQPDFTGDRIVETEEMKQQKKGWFSRRKPSSGTPEKVSRPPSAASWSKKSKTSMSSVPDDDLPPRMSSDGPEGELSASGAASPAGKGTSTPSNEAAESKVELPVHAGFDLNAIKEALKAEAAPEELKFQPKAVEPLPSHVLPHPTRADSTPLPKSPRRPPTPPRTLTSDPYSAEISQPRPSRKDEEDIAATFSRTTLHDNEEKRDFNRQFTAPRTATHQDSWSLPPFGKATQSFSSLQSPSVDNLAPSWSTPNSAASFGAGGGISPLSPFGNFQSNTSSLPPFSPDASLSFGGADGSITSFSPATPDPWQVPNSGKKNNAFGFNSNPWS